MNSVEISKHTAMAESLWCRVPVRKARLFAVACCRAVYHSLADHRSRRAVALAELHADGRATNRELWLANDAAEVALDDSPEPTWPAFAASWVADPRPARAAWEIACNPSGWSNPLPWTVKMALLRCLFGGSLPGPIAIAPSVLAWRSGTVLRVARAIYDNASWEDLPILGDALEEAGCADEALLRHCREPGPHARGCHALDAVLNLDRDGSRTGTETLLRSFSPSKTGGIL